MSATPLIERIPTYNVAVGDTFDLIARKTGTTPSKIQQSNPGIFEPLEVGSKLIVPSDARSVRKGIKAAAVAYSSTQTCHLLGIEAFDYLSYATSYSTFWPTTTPTP